MRNQYKPRTREDYEAREARSRKFIRGMINSLVFIFFVGYGSYLIDKNEIVTIGDLTLGWFGDESKTDSKWWGEMETYPVEQEQSMVEMIMGETPQTINAIIMYSEIERSDQYINGGVMMIAGLDYNGNEVLEENEIMYEIPILNGANGSTGVAGEDGLSADVGPYIGSDGYWYINDQKTHFPATNLK